MKKQIPEAMKKLILAVKEKCADNPKIGEVFETCYTNTLDTAIKRMDDGSTYVITGDIPAMWLRDSAAQLRPYLILAQEDTETADIILGLIKRQIAYILIDPYANAFNQEPNGACWEKDETERNDWIWERKYEIDSLCYPIQLAWLLWKNTGRTEQFNDDFLKAVYKIMEVFSTEQYHEERSPYRFSRNNTYFTDTLSRDGKGALVKSGVGLTWSGFRPSDDSCVYGYLIPSNMFACVILGYVEEVAEELLNKKELKTRAASLREEIYQGIETFGVTCKEGYGDIYAYEVDGYGQYHLMDDANVPSLLSMKYLGYEGKERKTAENTRRFILSEGNPYYYKGSAAKGIGSPHTPVNYIWHISLAIQGLTSETKEEQREAIETLLRTDGGTNMMHEGFHADHPNQYTREWFSWANAMFSELVLAYCGYEVKK